MLVLSCKIVFSVWYMDEPRLKICICTCSFKCIILKVISNKYKYISLDSIKNTWWMFGCYSSIVVMSSGRQQQCTHSYQQGYRSPNYIHVLFSDIVIAQVVPKSKQYSNVCYKNVIIKLKNIVASFVLLCMNRCYLIANVC